jgi:hypothetical protein
MTSGSAPSAVRSRRHAAVTTASAASGAASNTHVAAGDERARVPAAGARERVAQRVLVHDGGRRR